MSFSCPHFDPERDYCLRLQTDCVPGRAGCVLVGKAEFAVPVAERLREKEQEKREEFWAKLSALANRRGGAGK